MFALWCLLLLLCVVCCLLFVDRRLLLWLCVDCCSFLFVVDWLLCSVCRVVFVVCRCDVLQLMGTVYGLVLCDVCCYC